MSAADVGLLGRIAVHHGLITMDQLAHATRVQAREGGARRLGEVLIGLGYLDEASLQRLLALQKKHLQQAQAATSADGPRTVSGPHALPSQQAAAAAHASAQGATAPAFTASMPAMRREDLAAVAEPVRVASPEQRQLDQLLSHAVAAGASDVHIHSGAPVQLRIDGRLTALNDVRVTAEQAEPVLLAALSNAQRRELDARRQLDFAYAIRGVGRYRGNLYRQHRGLDGVFRLLALEPPSFSGLGLPLHLARFATYHQGMVLITGPSGSGKSSTMAALINLVNEERREHILSIEDPVEVLHPSRRCVVNQRQVGPHTESFARALRAALREDPDVIAIGELRDLETISLALTAAETGHLVFATLHTSDAVGTIERLIGVFPPSQQAQVRTMASESLRAVVSQRLVPAAGGQGRVAALEILVVTPAVGNLIRESKTFQARDLLQTGGEHGMCTLDASLAALVRSGSIARDEALRFCTDPKRLGA